MQRARATLPYGFLVKPYQPRELHATIEMAIARHAADVALATTSARRALALAAAGLAEWEYDFKRFVASERLAEVLDLPVETISGDPQNFLDRVDARDRPLLERAASEVLGGAEAMQVTLRARHADGSHRWLEVHGLSCSLGGKPRLLGVARDVTAERRISARMRAADVVVSSAIEAVVVMDEDLLIRSANLALQTMSGFFVAELLGTDLMQLRARRQGDDIWGDVRETLARGDVWTGETAMRRKDGVVFPIWQSVTRLLDPQSGEAYFVSVISDISQLRRAEEKLHEMAYSDALTGIPNRVLFERRVAGALQEVGSGGRQFAVLFIDLDDFKPINDRFGHAAGDDALRQCAQRIEQALRRGDLHARFGGDEFLVLLSGVTGVLDVQAACDRIRDAIAAPLLLAQSVLHLGASIGVAFGPGDGADAAALLMAADKALYQAKRAGGGCARFA